MRRRRSGKHSPMVIVFMMLVLYPLILYPLGASEEGGTPHTIVNAGQFKCNDDWHGAGRLKGRGLAAVPVVSDARGVSPWASAQAALTGPDSSPCRARAWPAVIPALPEARQNRAQQRPEHREQE